MSPQLGNELLQASNGKAQEESIQDKDDPSPEDTPSFLVEIRPEGKDPERFRLPLSDEATYVGDIVEKSGVINRFGRLKIQVWRPRPSEGGYHKLDVAFDRKNRTVVSSNNYAVHPKDLLVFAEDSSTIVDDMLGSISGPMRRFNR
jgi:hypothetical protein